MHKHRNLWHLINSMKKKSKPDSDIRLILFNSSIRSTLVMVATSSYPRKMLVMQQRCEKETI